MDGWMKNVHGFLVWTQLHTFAFSCYKPGCIHLWVVGVNMAMLNYYRQGSEHKIIQLGQKVKQIVGQLIIAVAVNTTSTNSRPFKNHQFLQVKQAVGQLTVGGAMSAKMF